jgi:hypothetical protein
MAMLRSRITRAKGTDFMSMPLSLVGFLIGAVFVTTGARAEEADKCARQEVTFDGVSPLSYATIQGGVGSKAYLHAGYPVDCDPVAPDSCTSPTYVLPGDVVAVAKTCSGWVYAEYIGTKRVTTGWIAAQQVKVSKTPVQDQSAEQGQTSEASSSSRHYHFALTRGHGIPVCEAYLQRLNQTLFQEPPYCGRPESTLVPGFDRLQRHWLDRSEYTRLYPSVVSFLWNRAIEASYVHRPGPDGKDVFGPPQEDFLPPGWLPFAWSYDPAVDIENTGTLMPVVIWSSDDRSNPRCLQHIGTHPLADRAAQAGVILRADHSAVDQDRTQAVFGHSGDKYPPFQAIGMEVGILRYHSVTYFDTFFSKYERGDFYGARRDDKRLRDTLGVFVHRNQSTQQGCEYYVNDQGE